MASHSFDSRTSARFSVIFLAISIPSVVAEFCQGFTDSRGNVFPGFQCPGVFDEFEEYKCCGTSDDHYCCNLEDFNNSYGVFYWSVGKIIGVVLGAVFGAVLFFVVVVIICCCYYRHAQKKRTQQTTNGGQQMTQVTATTQQTTQQQAGSQHDRLTAQRKRLLYEHVQGYPDVSQIHPEQNQGYLPQGSLQNSRNQLQYTQSDTYAPQVQAHHHPPSLRETPIYAHTQEPISPPPSYFSHQLPPTAGPHAPEVAPPPPPSYN